MHSVEREPVAAPIEALTARGESSVAAGRGELRDRLTLCKFHYEGVEKGIVACWGEPPLNVLWRLGIEKLASWYRNEWRLSPADVEKW
jgi:hypothetical protein